MLTFINQALVGIKNDHYFFLQRTNPELLATFKKEGDLERKMLKDAITIAIVLGLAIRVILTPFLV